MDSNTATLNMDWNSRLMFLSLPGEESVDPLGEGVYIRDFALPHDEYAPAHRPQSP